MKSYEKENTLGCDLWCVVDSVEITEDYVPFYTAKLLKEKGFDVPIRRYYNIYGEKIKSATDNHNDASNKYSRPTLQIALKWLREVHGLYINVLLSGVGKYTPLVRSIETSLVIDTDLPTYYSYVDAVVSAINYCLQNLVK